MKKTLCFTLTLALLLLSACGGREAAAPEPTVTAPAETVTAAAPDPTQEPVQDALEHALSYLHAQKGTFAQRHIYTYLELYRMTHPGANLALTGYNADNKQVYLDMTGLDVRAFAESGFLPDFVTVRSYGFANEFVPLDEPIPREPEWDRVSENGVRVTMDRAVWPVGAEYPRFILRNEGEKNYSYGAEIQLEKYVAGDWQPVRFAGGIVAIAYTLAPGKEVSLCPPTMSYPALGEGLYRVGFISKGEWAEFAVRKDAEPEDPGCVWRQNYPEAALLLAGLPETVESGLARATSWPSLSSSWELTAENPCSDEELVSLLLGEGAEYDASAGVYRLGDCTLSLQNGAELEKDTLLAKALRLALPPWDPEAIDLCAVPSLEGAGWKNGQQRSNLIRPLAGLYPWVGGTVYTPDPEVLNERLEAALEALGEDAGELQGFRFTKQDLKDVYLLVVPVCTEAEGPYSIPVCSPYGELAGAAAWCLCGDPNRADPEILALHIRLPGYRLEPGEAQSKTLSPLEQAEKFLPLLQEEGIKLLSFDYALIPVLEGNDGKTLQPVYRLRVLSGSGEEQSYVVSAVSRGPSAYDFPRRAYLEKLMSAHVWFTVFETCWEQYPEMDVWPVSGGIDRLEDGREYLVIQCDGVDCPALETSGLLPEGVALKYPERQFNQKLSHPCPREPEWENSFEGGTVTLTMAQAAYPLYPEYVELSVQCGKTFSRSWDHFEKYADGEWHSVREWMSGTLGLRYVEAGETVLQLRTNAKLGEGLYRLYLNEKYWVEFAVRAEG